MVKVYVLKGTVNLCRGKCMSVHSPPFPEHRSCVLNIKKPANTDVIVPVYEQGGRPQM